ncbi:MAG: RHS repeat-associated core domain-containing protein, partial [Bacteroidales bacterium]|nr:RHS repeat-associated core domain-containing protein [Bacteroidales bacterium]
DFGARFYDPATAIFLQQDPLAEKYYNISPYAYCANNPVNFVDPDGRVPVALPILGYMVLKSAVTAGGIIFTIAVLDKWEQSHDSSKYNPGYNHQRRRDRQNKRALDQAQLNVQNSINDNFPDPNDYDPNGGPELRSGSKLKMAVIISLALIDANKEYIQTLIQNYLKNHNEEETESETNVEASTASNDEQEKSE